MRYMLCDTVVCLFLDIEIMRFIYIKPIVARFSIGLDK